MRTQLVVNELIIVTGFEAPSAAGNDIFSLRRVISGVSGGKRVFGRFRWNNYFVDVFGE